jgi:phosphopantothenoylcysteine decarboxylase / phosphopantothenate---cysteine ligase
MSERVKVTVAVTGGVAAYKAVELVRLLQDAGLDPHVVMTRSAQEFVRPLTFSAISGHKVITTLWDESITASEEDSNTIEHIHEAQTTRALVVAPATANTLARFAAGIADDFLTTLYLATTAPVIVAPAMNVNMWNHPATQANLKILRERGVIVVEPGNGYLACGMVGGGRLADPVVIAETVLRTLQHQPETIAKDLTGQTVLITGGGTREPIDPVRFIGNRSSGRMGYALAEAASARGAKVILISANSALAAPAACDVVKVTTATEMRDAVMSHLAEASMVIMAAAVSDYRVANVSTQKLKRDSTRTLELEPTQDILKEIVSRRSPGTIVVGFAAETENILANGRQKLERKGVDAIVVNDVSSPETGFDSEQNGGTILTRERAIDIPTMSKLSMAHHILDAAESLRPTLATK